MLYSLYQEKSLCIGVLNKKSAVNKINFFTTLLFRMFEDQELKIIREPVLLQNSNGSWCCDICGHEEVQKEEVITHRIQHYFIENSKQCPICHKTFTQSSSLKSHLNIHTGIKKFRYYIMLL